MKIGEKIFAVLLAGSLAFGCMPAVSARTECPSSKFKDVNTSQYYHDGVDYMVKNGYMTGTSATAFSPSAPITRGMVLIVLYSMAGKPESGYYGTFADVKAGKYYTDAIEWGAVKGLASGYGDGTFAPNAIVTRQQLACFMYGFAKYCGIDTGVGEDTNILSYSDALAISDYAIPAMQWTCGSGLISGVSSSKLAPNASATRAQFAVIAYKFSLAKSAMPSAEINVASSARSGAEIPAYVTLPADYSSAKSYPMVILCHGHGGNHNEWGGFDAITGALARKGVIAVTLDYPGCGSSAESFTENTLTNMKADTIDVIRHVARSYSVDTGRVGIFGYSMGGRIALELLAEKSYNFAAAALVAPAEDTADLKNLFGGAEKWETMKADAKKNGFTTFTTIYGQVQQLSYKWFTDLDKYYDGLAEAAAENYGGDSMVVYATNDEAVSPSVSAGVAAALNSAVVNTYADGHGYSFYGKNHYTVTTVNKSSVDFFADELLNKASGISGYVSSINADGGLKLTIPASKLSDAGIKPGDRVTVTVDGASYTLPVCASVSDAAKGSDLLLVSGGALTVTVNGGDFAHANGIAAKTVLKNSGIQWYYTEGSDIPVAVTIAK